MTIAAEGLRVSAKSRLGEKLAYIHNQWDGLQTMIAFQDMLGPDPPIKPAEEALLMKGKHARHLELASG